MNLLLRKHMKNIILTIILLLLVACSTSEEYITVGFIGPLTGDVAIFGEVEKNAAEIAIEEINSAGGVNGKKLKIIYEDGKCSGKEAASAAQKLINIDKVKILFITCVAENLAVAPIAAPVMRALDPTTASCADVNASADPVLID